MILNPFHLNFTVFSLPSPTVLEWNAFLSHCSCQWANSLLSHFCVLSLLFLLSSQSLIPNEASQKRWCMALTDALISKSLFGIYNDQSTAQCCSKGKTSLRHVPSLPGHTTTEAANPSCLWFSADLWVANSDNHSSVPNVLSGLCISTPGFFLLLLPGSFCCILPRVHWLIGSSGAPS